MKKGKGKENNPASISKRLFNKSFSYYENQSLPWVLCAAVPNNIEI